MSNYIKQLEEKIKSRIEVEEIRIIDNSESHKNHKFFQKGKSHLIMEIKSNYLNSISRIDAERKIFSILKKDFENKIHALEIKLK